MTSFTTTFDPANPAHRTVPQWRTSAQHAWTAEARRFASTHGEARVLLANGQCVRYWREDGTIRHRTYRTAIMAHTSPTRGATARLERDDDVYLDTRLNLS